MARYTILLQSFVLILFWLGEDFVVALKGKGGNKDQRHGKKNRGDVEERPRQKKNRIADDGNIRNDIATGRGKKRRKRSVESEISVSSDSMEWVQDDSGIVTSADAYAELQAGDCTKAIPFFQRTNDHYGLSLCSTSSKNYEIAFDQIVKAVIFSPETPSVYFQRGRLAGFIGKYDVLINDLKTLVSLGVQMDSIEQQALNFIAAQYFTPAIHVLDYLIGSTDDSTSLARYWSKKSNCLEAIGNYDEAIDALKIALEYDASAVDAADESKLVKFLLDINHVEEAKALSVKNLHALEEKMSQRYGSRPIPIIESAYAKHLRSAVVLYQEIGEAEIAVDLATKVMNLGGFDFISSVLHIDCRHALGDFRGALEVLDHFLDISTITEVRGLFKYRREIICVYYCTLDTPFTAYSIDALVDSRIKFARTRVFGVEYEFVPMETYTTKWRDCAAKRMTHDSLYKNEGALPMSIKSKVRELLHITKPIRDLIQLNSTGVYLHKRKDRMAGFSVIEMSQLAHQHVQCILDGYDGLFVSNRGSSSQPQVRHEDIDDVMIPVLPYESFCFKSGRSGNDHYDELVQRNFHSFSWRDFYDAGVKWRQLAEPTDPVWWVDKLSALIDLELRESVSTPIYVGAKKVSRYYTYYEESFEFLKNIMNKKCYGIDNTSETCISLSEKQRQDLKAATTLSSVHRLVDKQDINVVADCSSAVYADRVYPCTKLVLLKSKTRGEGWEFRISATHSHVAYDLYFHDLSILFERYTNKLVALRMARDAVVKSQLQEEIVDDVFNILYTWIHSSPLTRGSAALSYTSTVALFLSADICLSGRFPANKQLDWEVLLSTTPKQLKDRVRPWFDSLASSPVTDRCPGITSAVLEGNIAGEYAFANLFPTTRHVLAALNVD